MRRRPASSRNADGRCCATGRARLGRLRADRAAAVIEAEVHTAGDKRDEQHDRAVAPAPPPCPLARLLDQRLDQRFQLAAVDRHGRAGALESGGRGGAVTAMTTSLDEATMTSTMLGVKVDRDEPLELHEQVAGEIRRAIADGEAKPGERLPPPKTSPPSSASTPTPSCEPSANSATKACSSSAAAAASPSSEPRNTAPSSNRPGNSSNFARKHGYKPDELIQIIQQLG